MEDQLLALAKRLKREEISLTYVFAGPPGPWLASALEQTGTPYRILDFRRTFAAATLLRWLFDARPDVVHFHFVRAYSPLVAAARLSSARVIVNDHMHLSAAQEGWRARAKRLGSMALNHLFDLRVAVSQEVAESVLEAHRVPPQRVVVIENGIDLHRADGVDGAAVRAELGLGDAPVVICPARLSDKKGVATAIRMMSHVDPRVILLVVGDGPEEKNLRELAATAGVSERVRFLGLRDDVQRLITGADVVVVPSHCEEAFGFALAEGMAAGKPVVVSRSGAMPALVGDTGIVVPKKDPIALAQAVSSLLSDPLLRARLGQAARIRAVERFDLSRYVDAMCRLYRSDGPSSAPLPAS